MTGRFKELRDDIPVASRSVSRRPPLMKVFLFFGVIALVPFFVIRYRPTSLMKVPLDLEPISNENVSLDGRLLGHFPYSEADPTKLVSVYPGVRVHLDTAKALNEMLSAAALDGISLSLLSGYRSHQLQKEIFFDVKSHRNQTAAQRAKVSAPPGYSEHSTGYAIDLGDATRPETHFREEFHTTRAFKWLQRNAPRYHFTLSFPEGNHQGVSYEPWHWRFEGSADALREFEKARIHSH